MPGKKKPAKKKSTAKKAKPKSKKSGALRKKRPQKRAAKSASPKLLAAAPSAQIAAGVTEVSLAEVTGACRFTDADGRRTCEDGVTQADCAGRKNSTFIPHGRCS